MVLFLQHYQILLLLLLEVLIIEVITSNDNIRKLGIFPPIMNSVASSIIRNSSDHLWLATKTITTMESVNYQWDAKWYRSMPIDHFSYRDVETFSLK